MKLFDMSIAYIAPKVINTDNGTVYDRAVNILFHVYSIADVIPCDYLLQM